ncbi:cathepsin L-like [Lineus longissimus]|uniref:cathepsin L-like n=1 Tax=Lineus longissimus TaxID=88925 RepID=UPI002B4E38AA
MIRTVLFLGLMTLTFALDLDAQWMSFKKTYAKDFQQTEELVRKIIFKENVAHVQKHNLQADMGMHTYWLGINEYTDWSHEEFVNYMNGINLNQNRTRTGGSTFQEPQYLVLPDTVDWRPKGFVTDVKNQKQCGSCWAFSATGALEGQHFKVKGKLVSLSEQNLVDCSKAEGNFGCHGGLSSNAFDYVRMNAGIDTEDCYPYEAKDDVCRFKSTCIGSLCVGYQDIPHGNETALQVAVATVGPISVAIDASHKSFQLYK